MWDPSTGATVCEARHKASISFLRFAPDSRYLATASAEPSVGVWALPRCVSSMPLLSARQPIQKRQSKQNRRRRLQCGWTPDCYSGKRPNHPAVGRDVGRTRMPPLRHRDNATAIEFSKDGTHLVTTSVDRMTTMWRVADGMPVLRSQGARRRGCGCQHAGMIATGSSGGDVDIWTPEGHRVALLPHSSDPRFAFCRPDGCS